jgi:regulator of protease activity HflC (stomatin/prohibitin superfamily)
MAPEGADMLRFLLQSPALVVVVAFALIVVFRWLNVLNEYERAVTFWLGRLSPTPKGPGLVFIFWPFEKMVKISMRTVVLDVPPQDVITRDNVSVKVNAVVYFRVVDPNRAVVSVENYLYATSQLSQTTLRSVLGEVELDELLADREKINAVLKKIIDERTDPWGIEVSAVEVKDVDLPDQMKRAMARQAEAERERQASATLADAAKMLASEPVSLQLRYLQTVTEIAAENNSTTIFPLPMDLLRPFMDMADRAARMRDDKAAAALPAPPTALPPGDKPMPAHELGDLMQRLREKALQEESEKHGK